MHLANIMAAIGGTAGPVSEKKFASLGMRIASASILIPPVLAAIHFGRPWFDILIGLMMVLMAWEWFQLVGQRVAWLFLGLFYLVIPSWLLVTLRADPEIGRQIIFWLFVVVWASDTGGYLVGSTVGGPKLAPGISPNKTWSGLIGAFIGGALAGWGAAALWNPEGTTTLIGFGILFAFVGQMGDLFESAIKRRFGVKDTGRLIPGHGGVLDRLDALLGVALVAGLIYMGGGGDWF